MSPTLRNSLGIDRPLGRVRFLLWAAGIVALEIGIKALITGRAPSWQMVPSMAEWPTNDLALAAWLLCSICASAAIVLLCLRRARDAGAPEFVAALAILPLVRLPLIVLLALYPWRVQPTAGTVPAAPIVAKARWRDAMVAIAAGSAFSVFSVTLGGLIFGSYAYTLYLLTPLYVGAIVGFCVNRRGEISMRETARAVWLATVAGSVLLLTLALEGVVCILLALPLTYAVALAGSVLGWAVARNLRHRYINAFGMVLVLPMAFALERLAEQSMQFEVSSEIRIAAPPHVVWNELVGLRQIVKPPALLFRAGVAYPVCVSMQGQGVGATRLGVFSTGTAIERVTVWEPEREFAFDVIEEPPSMRELSPYEHVHAPHVTGYFRTFRTSYRLLALPDGGTQVVETSWHALRMQPYEYWQPLASWMISQTHTRVLRQIRDSALREASGASAPAGADSASCVAQAGHLGREAS